MAHTHKQTHKQTHGHGDSMTDPAQRAESVKMVTFGACTDQLSRNLTDVLQLLEAFQRIISRLGTK